MVREWGRVIQTEVKRLARPTPGGEGDPGRGLEVGRGRASGLKRNRLNLQLDAQTRCPHLMKRDTRAETGFTAEDRAPSGAVGFGKVPSQVFPHTGLCLKQGYAHLTPTGKNTQNAQRWCANAHTLRQTW